MSTTFLIYFFISFETFAALSSAKIIIANPQPFVNNFFQVFTILFCRHDLCFLFPYKLCYNQIRNFAPSFNGRMEISMKITNEKQQYYGLDLLKFIMAVLVAARHVIQIYYPAESKWRLVIGCWLSNLAVPIFFLIAGFLLFQKIPAQLPNDTNTTDTDIKNSWPIARRYICRILKLYILWCMIYWPIDIYNWVQGNETIAQAVLFYLHSFFMSATITQLWYLPALAIASFIVWLFYRTKAKTWMLLLFTGILFILGCICDNRVLLEHTPETLQAILQAFVRWYTPRFMTMRNGVFYGSFYVALGAWSAKRERYLSPVPAALGSLFFLSVMYIEVSLCSNANMVLSAAPAVVCLTELALNLTGTGSRFFLFLREQSEWIYFSHYYFIHLFTWTIHYNPLPMTKTNIMLSVLVPMFLFTLLISFLSHRKHGKWLRALI